MIFVNLTTTDLTRSIDFYTRLGCTLNPQFSNDEGACMVWDEQTYFMVLTRENFSRFTQKQIVDPRESVQAILAFDRDSRAQVDETMEAGIAAGGRAYRETEDYGFMYQRSLEDPDGHILEFFFMEPDAVEQGSEAYLAEHGA